MLSLSQYQNIIEQDEKWFRGFIREHGVVTLRRLLYSLSKQHSNKAIAEQLDVEEDVVLKIRTLFVQCA
jgi:hypothetical protein